MNERSAVAPSSDAKSHCYFYGYIIVIVAFLLSILGWGTFYVYGVFFNPLVKEFAWTRATTSGAFSSSILVAGIVGIVAGRISDHIGPKKILVVCTFVLGVGYILMSTIHNIWQFYLIYGILVAFGVGGFWAPAVSTVARWFVGKRGLMTGIVSGGISFGTLVLPPILAQLIAFYDWRVTYIIMGVAVMILGVIAAQFLRSSPQTMGLSPQGLTSSKINYQSTGDGYSLKEALSTWQFWMVCAIYLFFGLFQFIAIVHIVPYAQDMQVSAVKAAAILSIIGGLSLAGRIIIGLITDKLRVKIAMIICLGGLTAAFIWLQFADGLWKLYLYAVLFGFGYGGLSCLQALIAAELFGLIAMGVITAIFSFSYDIGGAVGPLLAGYIYDQFQSYHWAFLIALAAAVIALIMSLTLKSPGKK